VREVEGQYIADFLSENVFGIRKGAESEALLYFLRTLLDGCGLAF
jgi:hypothetical protein